MIYTVECSYADRDSEAEWNRYYSLDKLPALISVRGFQTSQRFQALDPGCPVYLALHAIDGPAVLDSAAYRHKGGGGFGRWQPHITDWHRNLYAGLERAPAVGEGQHLIVSANGAEPFAELGLAPESIQAIALEKHPEYRWLAVLDRAHPCFGQTLAPGLQRYAPMTPQLTRLRDGVPSNIQPSLLRKP